MENRSHALIAGIFTIFFTMALVGAFWWFSGSNVQYKTYQIISTRSIVGLNAQSIVRFHGVSVGQVSDIELSSSDQQHVVITVLVQSDIAITRHTRAKLDLQGITGASYVLLTDDGKDPTPLAGVGGEPPSMVLQPSILDQVKEDGKALVKDFQETTSRLNSLLSDDNLAHTSKILKDLAASTSKLQKTMDQANALLVESRSFSTPENAQNIRESLRYLRQASKDIVPALEKFSQAMSSVNTTADRYNKIGLTLQKDTLPQANELLQNLQENSMQLDTLLNTIERSPQTLISGRKPGKMGPGESEEK